MPDELSLWERFREQARRSPSVDAVRWPGGLLSYAELEREAARMAAALDASGIAAGRVVSLRGSLDGFFVAALLGTLSRGAVACIAEDERILVELGAFELASMPELPEDDAREAPARASVAPTAPATVALTGGSSGEPRAVFVRHDAIARFIDWARDSYGVGPGDRVSALLPTSFYGAVGELLLPLLCGATLCVPRAVDREAQNAELTAWLRSAGITVVHAMASQSSAWLATPPRDPSKDAAQDPPLLAPLTPGVRLVLLTGERLMASHVDLWRAAAPEARIVNLYGQAESGLACCAREIIDNSEAGVQSVGEPLPGVEVRVVSPKGVAFGVGEPGEIAVRTADSSTRYEAGSTDAGRFVEGGEFRTGDRGALCLDGSLVVHGRLEERVRVHGIRLDLAMVEGGVAEFTQVRDVAVVPAPGERVAAYIVLRSPFLKRPIRKRMAANTELFPGECAVVILDALPKLPSGKVDRAALRARVAADIAAAPNDPEERPWTETEARVGDAWEELLGVRPQHPKDDFFTFGGTSLHLVEFAQLAARLRLTFGATLPLGPLLRRPTLEGMARVVDQVAAASKKKEVRQSSREAGPTQSRAMRVVWGLASAAALAVLLGALRWFASTGYHFSPLQTKGTDVFAAVACILLGSQIVAALVHERHRTMIMLLASVAAYPLVLKAWAGPILIFALFLCGLARARLRLWLKITAALTAWAAPLVARFVMLPLQERSATVLVVIVWAQFAYSTLYLLIERERRTRKPRLVDDLFYLLAVPRLIEPFFQPISPTLVRSRKGPLDGRRIARGLGLGFLGMAWFALLGLWQRNEVPYALRWEAVIFVPYLRLAGQIFISISLFRLLGYDLLSGSRQPFFSRSLSDFYRRSNHYVRDAVVTLFYVPFATWYRTRSRGVALMIVPSFVAVFVGSFLLNHLLIPVATSPDAVEALASQLAPIDLAVPAILWAGVILSPLWSKRALTYGARARAQGILPVVAFNIFYCVLVLVAWRLRIHERYGR